MKFHFGTLLFAILLVALSAPCKADAEDLRSSGFNITTGELCELLAFQRSIRLDPKAKVEADWNSRFAKLEVRELERSENVYAYAVDPIRNRQIVAIRGTANLVNALLDIEFWRDKSRELGIRLHHGFEVAASLVFKDLAKFLDRDIPIVVCGHSLGAAEAIIVGMFLKKSGYTVEKIVASGPPKVTDAEGWRAYAALPVIRIAAAYDPVPFLPPAGLYPSSPLVQGGPLLMLLDGPYLTIAPPDFYDAIGPAFREAKAMAARFDVVDHRVWTYCDRAEEKGQTVTFVPFARWELFARPRKD